jgi:ABC-2 type transport system ATP-binding protein
MKHALAVNIEHLTKKFPSSLFKKAHLVLNDFSWQIPEGKIAALLGPNGSGKSTLLKILLGFLLPTQGSVKLFGSTCRGLTALHRLGFLPERPNFQLFLNAKEVLTFYGKLSHIPSLSTKIEELLILVGLFKHANDLIATYSQGMRQRLALAQTLIHDPNLLILDEPTTGLDPSGIDFFFRLLLELKKSGKTILLTSHVLTHVEEVCDQIAIIENGNLLYAGNITKTTPFPAPSSLQKLYLELIKL